MPSRWLADYTPNSLREGKWSQTTDRVNLVALRARLGSALGRPPKINPHIGRLKSDQ